MRSGLVALQPGASRAWRCRDHVPLACPTIETARFDYHLPANAIAQTAIEPRHDARLLDTRDGSDHRFRSLPDLLRPGDLVVLNRTRVRHARLRGSKVDTGGVVEALLLGPEGDGRWRALLRPARRLRCGAELVFGQITARLESDPVDGVASLRLDAGGVALEDAIRAVGEMPLPPYFQGRLADPERYQTVFGDRIGSAAAPTASLHLTEQVLETLTERSIEITMVELDVGLATFRPVSNDHIEDHSMHRERCAVSEKARRAIAECRKRDGRVVAIGTTVVRALETARSNDGLVEAGEWATDLYLRPGSAIGVVDLLVTNFHLPRSSLLVLVEAFMGPDWREAYRTALDRGYRFLSFGDAMLCERKGR